MSKAYWLSAALGFLALSCIPMPSQAAPSGSVALKGAIGETEVQKAHWGHRRCWRHHGHWHCRRHVRHYYYPRYYYGGYSPYYYSGWRPGISIHIGRRHRWW
jgi:hypothetical protein